MTASKDNINAKIDEYHLMIEEVLGGMDMTVSRLESRIKLLEEALVMSNENKKRNDDDRIQLLSKDLKELKSEVTEGLNLAFRKIAEKS